MMFKIKGEYVPGFKDADVNVSIPTPNGWDDLQTGKCPDCGGQWVWAEAGYVPGTRECTSCHSLFSVKPTGDMSVLRRERFY